MYGCAWITMCLYVYECICVSWVRICIRVGKGLLAAQVFSLFFDFFDFSLFGLSITVYFIVYIFLRLVCSFDEKWKVPAPLLRHRVICD